ncbi:uncharacterized protein LOC133181544 [Saccostrea echinata]|uniref:uncharacterized protein LOC133181544 n=1 Tax=Saccostrea echinata TaxID=191078 RepID=UPI002A8238F4|nr:uncharacterized protein LOC133181544 [Saccostrea echinata]
MALQWIVIVSLLISSAIGGGRDNMGTEFILGFMENKISGTANNIELFVTTTSNTPADITVTTPLFDPSFSETTTVSRGNIKKLELTYNIRGSGTAVENKGVRIVSTQEITVYGVNKERYSTDGFVAFPVDAIGLEYVLATWKSEAVFMIIGTEDGTTVQITLSSSNPTATSITYNGATYSNGQTLSVSLNKYQTFHAFSSSGDFTGTKLVSNKVITVMTGNRKVAVKDSMTRSSSDHLVEQVPPIDTLGKDFFTISTPDRNIGDYFRIIATEDSTEISLAGSVYTTINQYEYTELNVVTGDYKSITSNKPVMVTMFGKTISTQSGDGPNGGDPQFSILPAVPQFPSDYTFSTIQTPTGDFNNYLVVVIKDSAKNDLKLDEQSPSGVTWTPVSGSSHNLVVATFEVNPGSHSVYNTKPSATFLGMAFGNAQTNSYSYAAGTRLAPINGPCTPSSTVAGDIVDNDCDGWIDEEESNGIDDDGDGSIDEDLANLPRINGNWAAWGQWSACSLTCNSGTGSRSRSRTCTDPAPANNGIDCVGSGAETGSCTVNTPCPIDGQWGSWSAWNCSRTCGNGLNTRNRECDNPAPQHNGADCSGNSTESGACWAGTCYPSVLGNLDKNCTSSSFGCKAGNIDCVDLEKSCDGAVDCTDGSDEDPQVAGCTPACSGAGVNDGKHTLFVSLSAISVIFRNWRLLL